MIIDTTVLIDLMNGDRETHNKIRELELRGEPCKVTTLSVFELRRGVPLSEDESQEKQKITEVLQGQTILPLDIASVEIGGVLSGLLQKQGKSIGGIDTIISGIALAHKEKVLTRNVKDFSKVPGLHVETY
ncbi:MAG TPA: PIN domain-containing protein [Candidatus Nanoarchaeia archaeon]|nr:PIN domain-containing protein [Candidatus Nanoarchaeia archaeon]